MSGNEHDMSHYFTITDKNWAEMCKLHNPDNTFNPGEPSRDDQFDIQNNEDDISEVDEALKANVEHHGVDYSALDHDPTNSTSLKSDDFLSLKCSTETMDISDDALKLNCCSNRIECNEFDDFNFTDKVYNDMGKLRNPDYTTFNPYNKILRGNYFDIQNNENNVSQNDGKVFEEICKKFDIDSLALTNA